MVSGHPAVGEKSLSSYLKKMLRWQRAELSQKQDCGTHSKEAMFLKILLKFCTNQNTYLKRQSRPYNWVICTNHIGLAIARKLELIRNNSPPHTKFQILHIEQMMQMN